MTRLRRFVGQAVIGGREDSFVERNMHSKLGA